MNEICCLNTGVFSFPIKLFGKGVFSVKGDNQNSICEELPVDAMNGSCLEEEISAIHKGRSSLQSMMIMEQTKNSIHFENYRHNTTLGHNDEKLPQLEQHKRTRLLRNKNGKEQKFDASQLNPNHPVDIYTSVAKNQQEERLVTKELTSLELRNIAVGPVLIDMGTILLRSAQKKYFHICNFNQKPISIKLEATHESFN